MEILIHSKPTGTPADLPVEVVERKGRGHPDTLCDAIAERISVELCHAYLDRFGMVMHHNVDKVLLRAGASRPACGGGEVLEPLELYLCGRATHEVKGKVVPVEDIARTACEAVLDESLHALDLQRHVRILPLIRPGSAELVELFERHARRGTWLANDTSCGVGFAPLTAHERLVLDLERHLTDSPWARAHPIYGEDVKVMGVRSGDQLRLTIACALVDRHVDSVSRYVAAKEHLRREALSFAAATVPELHVTASVNAADAPEAGSLFLTVTGTSAECGDDGQTGRGNRAGGLITPRRPMTLEAAAGKNPVTHVGKLYSVAAADICTAIVREVPGVTGAECLLVSEIGSPVTEPAMVEVSLSGLPPGGCGERRDAVLDVVRTHLAGIPELWRRLLAREVRLY